jgi:uncharacterized membrane protein
MTASRTTSTRTRIAAGLAAVVAALAVAAPAQAELVGGVRDGGCLQGVQVGSAHNGDGSVTPICRIIR